MTIRPDDNWLQRAYFGWAERHYRRMPPATRAEVERIDRLLYSRRGAWIWFALAVAVVACAMALTAAGLPPLPSLATSLGLCVAVPGMALGAWLQPERFAGRKALGIGVLLVLGICVGAAAGFLAGRIAKLDGLHVETLWPAVRIAVADMAPLLAVAAVVLGATLELTAFARRRVLKAELERTRLVAERDAASRQAAEARLRLLQGQIRPHFIFNTLASLQHWVDTGDARAGPLLRSLTALLRTSTQAMEAPLATVAVECDAARHYLAVMRARLGERLSWDVAVDDDCAALEMPAGLVLTLVENAVEHGIQPMLAGGRIEVSVAREGGAVVLRVDDDGAGLGDGGAGAAAARSGVGLANSRERLRHRYGDAASLALGVGRRGRGTLATVRVEADAA